MGKNSSIEWTDHTFNPWWGCAKVSPACLHCYAETWAKRCGAKVWGRASERRLFGSKHWAEPQRWNQEAMAASARRRVFCASMADVFELRRDLNEERAKLWKLIEQTPFLDWLLLTKRPQNVARMVPWQDAWPQNVWLGTTVEDQKRASLRLPHLLALPARIRFLSCEPLLGSLDLSAWIPGAPHRLDWVIAGGESGPGARPMLPGNARSLRDQCAEAGIPFHFKQWGHWAPVPQSANDGVTEFWDSVEGQRVQMAPLGKKVAGRKLDGITWDGLPFAA